MSLQSALYRKKSTMLERRKKNLNGNWEGEGVGERKCVDDATEARKSSLKLATRADGDAAKGDRVFMSKRVWRREYEG